MPTTRATVNAINADGWTVQDSSPITYDPVGSPQYVVALRPGFDATGTAATITDNVVMMKRKRLPYPSQASLTANTATLSDFVYVTDTVAGVTNNSTRVAPLPQAMWLTPDLERARTPTFTVRLAVSHAHARNGTPVAAVKFIATDGTNSVNVVVSAMSSRQWASGLFGAYYEATLDVSTLNAATICTVDAVIYPWVGVAFQASVNGATYPSANFTVLKFLNDRTGSFGEAYAYVDPAGNNGTAVTSANPATAAASPYLTIAAAAAGIKTFNNSTYARNLADGGTIRLNAGTYTHASFSVSTVTNYPLVIEASNSANKATTIIQDASAHMFGSWPKKMRLRNLTLKKIGGDFFFLDNGAANVASGNLVTLENVKVDQNGTSNYAGWFGDVGRLYVYECDCATTFAAFNRYSGGDCKEINVIGSDIKSGTGGPSNVFFGAFASKLAGVGITRGNGSIEDSDGTLTAYCFITAASTEIFPDSTQVIGAKGWAMVMSVAEATATPEVSPGVELWDGGTGAAQNIVLQGNTLVGARTNLFYNDATGANPNRVGYVSLNVIENLNIKSDVFATDGANVNNWSNIYKTSWLANCILRGSYDGASAPGIGIWMGEVAGLGETNGSQSTPLAANFVNDASGKGTGAGNGDYTPGSGSAINVIPAGWAVYPIDQKGRSISNSGTGKTGAIQPAVTLIGVGTIVGSGVASGLSGASVSAAGAALLAAISGATVANTGAAVLAGRAGSKPALVGSATMSGLSAAIAAAVGAAVLSAASGAQVAATGTAAMAGLSGASARALTTTALSAIGGATVSMVGAAILANGSASLITPTFAIPGTYRLQSIGGAYGHLSIPGRWRAAS